MPTRTSTQSGNWSSTSTWADSTVPLDDDTVVIAAGHSVLMNADTSGFATGINGLTITSHATTPGKLYFANGTNGYLKMKSNTQIVGTALAAKGQLVANSDGAYATTSPLQSANTAVILFTGTLNSGGGIVATNLDINLRAAAVTNPYGRTYRDVAASISFSAANDTVTGIGSFTVALNDVVAFRNEGGALASPLQPDEWYFVREFNAGESLKVGRTSGGAVIGLTTDGSGVNYIYSGLRSADATKTCKTIEDCSDWPVGAKVVLCNQGSRDVQRDTVASRTSSQVVLTTTNIDSDQIPLSRLWLIDRNVCIAYDGTTAQNLVSGLHAGDSLYCELSSINNWSAMGTRNGNTNYAYGITGNVASIGGIISGFHYGAQSLSNATTGSPANFSVSFNSIANSYIYNCSRCTFTGTVSGADLAYQTCTNILVTGDVIGSSTMMGTCSECSFSGNGIGGTVGVSTGTNCSMSGKLLHYTTAGFRYGQGAFISGTIARCGYAAEENYYYELRNSLFRDNTTADLRRTILGVGYNATLASTTTVADYLYQNRGSPHNEQHLMIHNMGGVSDFIAAYSPSGNTRTETYVVGTHGSPAITPPFNGIHRSLCIDNRSPHVVLLPYTTTKGVSFTINVYARIVTGSSFDALPVFRLVSRDRPIIDAGRILATWTMTNNNNWQNSQLTWSSTYEREIALEVELSGGNNTSTGNDDILWWFQDLQPNGSAGGTFMPRPIQIGL